LDDKDRRAGTLSKPLLGKLELLGTQFRKANHFLPELFVHISQRHHDGYK